MERRLYARPPIQEALCEFQFAVDPQHWDLVTLPGRLHEQLQPVYSGKPEHLLQLDADLQLPGLTQEANVRFRQGAGRIRYPNAEGTQLVTVGPGVLSIHVLEPYPGWDEFHQRIADVLQTYEDIVRPGGVTRIGLRYINRITGFPTASRTSDYVPAVPQLPESLRVRPLVTYSRTEARFADIPGYFLLTIQATPCVPEGSQTIVLDLDLIWQSDGEQLPAPQALEWVEKLRAREREAFEVLITDRARELFDA